MGKVNYAAIDIGSNAVRLLIKSIDREAVQEKKIKKVMSIGKSPPLFRFPQKKSTTPCKK